MSTTVDLYHDDQLDIGHHHPAGERVLGVDPDEHRSPPLIGIAVAVAFSIPLWALIGMVVWLVR